MDKKLAFVGIVIILLLVAAYVVTSKPAVAATNQVALQLTDPAQVPAGTQALVISYSSLQVHLSNANNQSGWLSASGSGSIDLLVVLNLTQTIGTVALQTNATINMVRFNVSGATIKINGTTYNVTVPSNKVTAHVLGAGKASVGNSSILIELSPVVASIITNSSTVFVLVPSVRAVVVPHGTSSVTLKVGARAGLTKNETIELEETRPNLTITGASLSVGPGNVTSLSVTVKDNSNSSVFLQRAGFVGNLSVKFNSSALLNTGNDFISQVKQRLQSSGICSNFSAATNLTPAQLGSLTPGQIANLTSSQIASIVKISPGVWANLSAQAKAQIQAQVVNSLSHPTYVNANYTSNITAQQKAAIQGLLHSTIFGTYVRAANVSTTQTIIRINSSLCTQAGLAAFQSELNQMALAYASRLRSQQNSFKFMIFSITGSGALQIPTNLTQFSGSGYTMQAGQSATFAFSGLISFNNGQFKIAPIAGAAYKIGIEGQDGASAVTSVTATSG